MSFISAGTPWRGSVRMFQLLRDGWGLATPLIGGVDGFRRTILSFPSMFELMPFYDGCCGGEEHSVTTFDPMNATAWATLDWAGVESDGLPDLAEIRDHRALLRDLIEAPLAGSIDESLIVAVDQRTPEHYTIALGDGEAQLSIGTSWEGDGTVMRDSAMLHRRVVYPTSFATHDAILNDVMVQDFVLAALEHGSADAITMVPVRERTSIVDVLGELVGIAIATDQSLLSRRHYRQSDCSLALG